MTIEGSETRALRHTGALLGYRSLVVVDFVLDRYTVVHWTLADVTDGRGNRFRNQLERLAFGD